MKRFLFYVLDGMFGFLRVGFGFFLVYFNLRRGFVFIFRVGLNCLNFVFYVGKFSFLRFFIDSWYIYRCILIRILF